MSSARPIRIGTRASQLARRQSDWTAQQLRNLGVEVEIIEITTRGDVETRPLASVGGEGLFTKAIQQALLDGQVDLAVHSLKDLPTEPTPGLQLAAIPEREAVHDLLIAREPIAFEDLPQGAVVGTGSLRRKAQLLHVRPDLQVREIRGNLDTRLRKLTDGDYDAIILAAAGVRRLGWDHLHTWPIPTQWMLPAVGQGALGLETRVDDEAGEIVAALDHRESRFAVLAERALLRQLRAGCLAPVGALGIRQEESFRLDATVLDPHGQQRLQQTLQFSGITWRGRLEDDAEALTAGVQLAELLLEAGADELIRLPRNPEA